MVSVYSQYKQLKEALFEDIGNGFRVKKHKHITMVYNGDKHVGNVIAPKHPETGQYKAVSKNWGNKKVHGDEKSALNWLISINSLQVPGGTALANEYTPPGELVESKYTTSTHQYIHPTGAKAQLIKHTHSNGDVEFTSHVHDMKLTGQKMVRHSTQEKAHQRLIGLGFKHTGETTKEETMPHKRINVIKKEKKDLTTVKPVKSFRSFHKEELEDWQKRDKEAQADKVKAIENKEPEDSEKEFQIKKTASGSQGDVIKINPKLNRPPQQGQATYTNPDIKKRPNP